MAGVTKSTVATIATLAVLSAAIHAQGRGQASPPPTGYPERPAVSPVILERGKVIYEQHCTFCHGRDARGGDGGGPNLLRSQLVLTDQKGELIGEVVRNGRPGTVMMPIALTPQQISDVADYIHSFRVGGYDVTRNPPVSIVVGNAAAGEATFKKRCASCHSVAGDLKGLATRIAEPQDLQTRWLMPSALSGRGRGAAASTLKPTMVTVSLPTTGQKIEGRLVRIDDFIVTLIGTDGLPRSFTRSGDTPKVEIVDPLKPHRDLLPTYSDAEVHDITAYLVTQK